MRKSLMIIFSSLFMVFLVACSNNSAPETSDVKELVTYYSGNKLQDVTAAITSDLLIVTDKGKETSYELPEDEFFVSIAPYLEVTHG